MNCQVGDIIKIDGKNNIVLTNFDDNNNIYSFINELRDDLLDVTDLFFLVKHLPGGAFEKVVDPAEVDRLYPKIQQGLQQSMVDNNINIDELRNEFDGEGAE